MPVPPKEELAKSAQRLVLAQPLLTGEGEGLYAQRVRKDSGV
jgi:hypothetical protein